MDIKVESGDITKHPAKAIIVNLFDGVKKPGGATGAVDKALGGGISGLIAEGEIKGKTGEVTLVHSLGKIPSPRVLVAGLGKQEKFGAQRHPRPHGYVAAAGAGRGRDQRGHDPARRRHRRPRRRGVRAGDRRGRRDGHLPLPPVQAQL